MEKYIYEDSRDKIVSPALQDQMAMIDLSEEEMALVTGSWGGYHRFHHHHHRCYCYCFHRCGWD
jgi:hypothetical protein